MRTAFPFLLVLAALCLTQPLSAAPITFTVVLNGAQEVPPNGSPATGSATVTVDDVMNSVMVSMVYSGLTAPAANAHIHCCNGPGVNSPVVIPFAPPFVLGATSGSFDWTFENVSPTFIAGLQNYGGYINVHTATYPGGEIRADLVPEPGTLALLGLGLTGLALWKRRSS